MSELTFNPETHEYKLAGRTVPSVTQVIDYVMPQWQAEPWYLGRGTAIHHGCRLLDENRLDWSTVVPEIEPRIRAWQRFRDEWPAEILSSEKPLASPLQFAGTPDRIFERDDKVWITDLKSSLVPQIKVQLGGYSVLYSANNEGRKAFGAVGVELQEDGSYKTLWLNSHELRRAEQTFLALVTVFNFMKTNGIRGNGNG